MMKIRDKDKKLIENTYNYILTSLNAALVGQQNAKKVIAASLMCDTNARILLNGKVGAGKTKLAKYIASAFESERISITNDVFPSDIEEHLKDKTKMQFLLLEELNRARGITQSAFVELLEENQMTITSKEKPYVYNDFYVFATMNNTDFSGVFPVSEAVYDRFDVSIHFEDLTEEEKRYLLFSGFKSAEKWEMDPDFHLIEYLKFAKETIEAIPFDESDEDILMEAISYVDDMKIGEEKLPAGTNYRGDEFILKLAKLHAITKGRRNILPADIAFYIKYVFMHRINQSVATIGSQPVIDTFDETRRKILSIETPQITRRGR